MTSKTADRAFDVGRALDGGPWSAYQKWLGGRAALTRTLHGIGEPLRGASDPTRVGAEGLPARGGGGVLAAGGVLRLLTAAAFFRLLPESPRFLARHPRRRGELVALLRRMGQTIESNSTFEDGASASGRSRLAELFVAEYRRDTILLWIAFFSCLLSVYLGFSWLPSVIAGAGLGDVASASSGVVDLCGAAG